MRAVAAAERTLVAWCPYWPLLAVDALLDEPCAVTHANRIVTSSPVAREYGVTYGIRTRTAHQRCAELTLHVRDESREVQMFEPIVAVLDNITPRIEVLRPGTCSIVMRGPSRYFGGETKVAELVRSRMNDALAGRIDVRIGVADGPFAAELAARAAAPIRMVPSGDSASFLAPMRIEMLERPELTDVLVRLGISTFGEFASLPAADVSARFGSVGLAAHRLALGLQEHLPDSRSPALDRSAVVEIDPPADRVDRVAFMARRLADELHRRLRREGMTCVRIAVEAETEHGEQSCRLWRHEGMLSSVAIADRVRWQLDGWLNGSPACRPSGGIAKLTLVPEELIAAKGRQLGFWGDETEIDERVTRATARLQGRLGVEAVKVIECKGGRHPDEQLVLVPAATVDLRSTPTNNADSPNADSPPWPGSLPAPSPTRILDPGEPVDVFDADERPVRINGRGQISAPPHRIVAGHGKRFLVVVAWSAPWPVDERWWITGSHRRLVRIQVVTDDGVARLLALEQGRWRITALWD